MPDIYGRAVWSHFDAYCRLNDPLWLSFWLLNLVHHQYTSRLISWSYFLFRNMATWVTSVRRICLERENLLQRNKERGRNKTKGIFVFVLVCFCFLFFPSHYYRSHQCLHPHTRNYLVRSRKKETLVRYRISGTELLLIRTLRAQMLLNSAWPVAGFQTGLFYVQIRSNPFKLGWLVSEVCSSF